MRCNLCRHVKPDVRLRVDPYVFEIYDEVEERALCDDCFDSRKDDI